MSSSQKDLVINTGGYPQDMHRLFIFIPKRILLSTNQQPLSPLKVHVFKCTAYPGANHPHSASVFTLFFAVAIRICFHYNEKQANMRYSLSPCGYRLSTSMCMLCTGLSTAC